MYFVVYYEDFDNCQAGFQIGQFVNDSFVPREMLEMRLCISNTAYLYCLTWRKFMMRHGVIVFCFILFHLASLATSAVPGNFVNTL